MIQCESCEFFARDPNNAPLLLCDPFSTIKEPECIQKHQLAKLVTLAQSHQATLDMYKKIAPLQEKMIRHVEREIDETEDADRWKYESLEDTDEDDEDDPFRI